MKVLSVAAHNRRMSQFSRNLLSAEVFDHLEVRGMDYRSLNGAYMPTPSRIVLAPKRGGTRPGASLSFAQQIEWSSIAIQITNAVQQRVERVEARGMQCFLPFGGWVKGFPNFRRQSAWQSRLRRSAEMWRAERYRYCCTIDVLECYPSVTGTMAARVLREIGVDMQICDRVEEFIEVYGHGLPIGELASDLIIKAILAPAYETALWYESRCVAFLDDFLVFSRDRSGAACARVSIGESIQNLGLLVNPSKTRVHEGLETRFHAFGIALAGFDIEPYIVDEGPRGGVDEYFPESEYPGLGRVRRRHVGERPHQADFGYIADLRIDVDGVAVDEYDVTSPARSDNLMHPVLQQVGLHNLWYLAERAHSTSVRRPWHMPGLLSSLQPVECEHEFSHDAYTNSDVDPWRSATLLHRSNDWTWRPDTAPRLAAGVILRNDSRSEVRAEAYSIIDQFGSCEDMRAAALGWSIEAAPEMKACVILALRRLPEREDFYRYMSDDPFSEAAIEVARKLSA